MAAYVIVDLRITHPDQFEAYKQRVPDTLTPYGGKFLARGGRVETLEGGWNPERLVVLEFPTLDQAKAWWSSEEYREPKAMREASAQTKMIVVESL